MSGNRRLRFPLALIAFAFLATGPVLAEAGEPTPTATQGAALELGLSIAFRPSVEWISERRGILSAYYGLGTSWMLSPFPVTRSQGPEESYTFQFLFYPEASAFVGARATGGGVLDAGLELHLGGDAYLEQGRLELRGEGIDASAFSWAVTPLAWLEPTLRYNLGILSGIDWLRRLTLEARLFIPVGDVLCIYERFRAEFAMVARP